MAAIHRDLKRTNPLAAVLDSSNRPSFYGDTDAITRFCSDAPGARQAGRLLRCIDAYPLRCRMEDSVRWTVKVSRDTDVALRSYFAQRGLRKGELSRFVERAVRKEMLAQTAAALKARNQDVPYARLQAIVDEALLRCR